MCQGVAAMAAAVNDEPDRDFYIATDAEPHKLRRRAMLAKYGPEIRKLYGYDPSTAVQVMGVTVFQVIMAYLVRDSSWWTIAVLGYVISATCNQNLFCAQHELSHFLALKKPAHNKVISILSNCPLVVPTATTFRKYHQEHHSHLGVDGWDVDLPTFFEASWINTAVQKFLWVFCYIIVYGLRPMLVRPKSVGAQDVVNIAVVVGFDVALVYTCGFKSLAYLIIGTVMGGGLHPMAGHLIAEHYMFAKGQETYSYYGSMNHLTYNVGFHNEHHDFPQIPHTRLYRLKEIAPEFYLPLKHHTSYLWVIWCFLTDKDVGPWTRMRRTSQAGTPLDQVPPKQRTAAALAAAQAASIGRIHMLAAQ
eukprot:CAMPEP_0206139322 /NCGR_PEP_ID=MMETSP1473-20131121/5530_1 /ASSEMBLY_ACC=CAM_ASM_001109 /TAXON_ID=1461547 /ORGANISM="Stichococcus sp, Strain RCC1054" /LENGTH=361 /DNA_ID=CAMNT_0053533063 /DNA_START=107 /DNA_END=1192 /DNA_ORIENTATION=+